MASLFAARMLQAGHDVWMVSGWKEQLEKIAADGLILSEDGHEDLTVFPHTASAAEEAVTDGVFPNLVMIWSKGYQTERTIKNALPLIAEETLVVTLQNGMGNAEIIAKYVPAKQVFFGSASMASDAEGFGHVKDTTNRNRSPLISVVPFTRQDDGNCAFLADLFNSLGYSTAAGAYAEIYVWKKLCLNACGNALAGISQLANYVYSNDQDGFILISKILAECIAVANANGVPLDFDEMRAFAQATYYNQHHFVSMCQDMHNKRQTEIETINGFIVSEGRRLGISTPVNETLVHLVRLIQRHYADQWV